ncbi:MAG: PP2C family protein-serine/threonine phosphatase [Gemmatimonadales bacterium]
MSTLFSGGIDVFGASDVGLKRTNNEDHFMIAELTKAITLRQTNLEDRSVFDSLRGAEAQLMAVADGVGGTAGGEIASGTAVTALVEYVSRATGCFNAMDTDSEHDFLAKLENVVLQAHERVKASTPGGTPPATTLTMVTFVWPRAYIVHVGDSRAMYLHNGRLRTLTRDQTMAEALVDAGALTPEAAARSSLSHTLYSALGSAEVIPSVGLVDFTAGDVLLLCSDGLTKHVTDERIQQVLSEPVTAEAMAKKLIAEALAGGGSDNVTVVVARIVG